MTAATRHSATRPIHPSFSPPPDISLRNDMTETTPTRRIPCKLGQMPLHIKKRKTRRSPSSSLIWWPRPGSNRRHTDFQSVALPTELPSHSQEIVNGRSRGIRTHDPVIKSHLLYQLSYAPIHIAFPSQMERAKGLEPSTTTLARWHSTN